MPVQTTKAIVIKSQSLGELDKIISFYTLNFGKVRAVARGIKRPKNRYGGSLELLNYGDLIFFFRPHKDLQIINSFDILDSFDTLKGDLTKTAYAFYIAELLDATGVEGKISNVVFRLTLQALSNIKIITHPELLVYAYELQLLALTGFKPQLQSCVGCSNNRKTKSSVTEGNIAGKTFRFSPSLGGMLCSKCFYKDASALSLSRGTYELMKKMQTLDLSLVKRVSASETVKHELKKALLTFTSYQLERQFKSLNFIDDISRKNGNRAREQDGKTAIAL